MIKEEALQSPLSEQEKRDFCADMLRSYGLQINTNNELLPVLYLAYRSSLITQSANKKSNDAIQKVIADFQTRAIDKIGKLETKQVQFKDSRQAFWYSFGWPGLPLVIITVVLCVGWLLYNYQNEAIKSRDEKISQLSFLLDNAVIRPKQINDTTTAHIINLYPSSDYKNARAGKHFIYNQVWNFTKTEKEVWAVCEDLQGNVLTFLGINLLEFHQMFNDVTLYVADGRCMMKEEQFSSLEMLLSA